MKTFKHPYDIREVPIGEEIMNERRGETGIVVARCRCSSTSICPDCKLDGWAYKVRRKDGIIQGWCCGLWGR